MKKIIPSLAALALFFLVVWGLLPTPNLYAWIEPQQSDQERVAKNKETILKRIKREKPTFRGDKPGEIRLRWEWHDKVINNYVFEKAALLEELSAGEKFDLRPRWVYKDMKVTFEELFQFGDGNDDKLIPIISHAGLLAMAPSATFEGLTLLGKHGEVKGTITRKHKIRVIDAAGIRRFVDRLEYKEPGGKLSQTFIIWSYDAFTVRWKDIKDRIADDMTEEKAIEDLKLERDATFPEQATPGT